MISSLHKARRDIGRQRFPESATVDILVRNLDEDIARRLKEKAAAKGTSLNETAREALTAYVKPSKAEAWAAADRIRAKIGKVSGDSTADIREDRDSR
jgi:plasmid stability protein